MLLTSATFEVTCFTGCHFPPLLITTLYTSDKTNSYHDTSKLLSFLIQFSSPKLLGLKARFPYTRIWWVRLKKESFPSFFQSFGDTHSREFYRTFIFFPIGLAVMIWLMSRQVSSKTPVSLPDYERHHHQLRPRVHLKTLRSDRVLKTVALRLLTSPICILKSIPLFSKPYVQFCRGERHRFSLHAHLSMPKESQKLINNSSRKSTVITTKLPINWQVISSDWPSFRSGNFNWKENLSIIQY